MERQATAEDQTRHRWLKRALWVVGGLLLALALSACLPPRGAEVDATSVSTGQAHACAVTKTATVRCWGANLSGRLGDGTTTGRPSPVDVAGLTGVAMVSAGDRHTCAVGVGGEVTCWGDNDQGQLGDGTTTDRTTPVAVLSGAVSVSAGPDHTCAVLAAGGVRCWGRNANGQLGDDTTTSSTVPVATADLATATAVSTGASHSCARLADGTAQCWGLNAAGRLGDGTTTDRLTPVAVSELAGVTQIDAGGSATCARLADATARCWGENSAGQLGNGGAATLVPVMVSDLTGVSQVSAGRDHACATLDSGRVWCWGSHASTKLGDGTNAGFCVPACPKPLPVPVVDREPQELMTADSFLDTAKQVDAGGSFTCAVKTNGSLKCWGNLGDGQLGVGQPKACPASGSTSSCREPVYVGVNVDVVAAEVASPLSSSADHTCTLEGDGTAVCWGSDAFDQLGNEFSTAASRASSVRLSGVVDIATGNDHTCAVLADGTVSCWGRSRESTNFVELDGRLGYASAASAGSLREPLPRSVTGGDPTDPPAITTATAVTAGDRHTCALLGDGTVACWGDNSNGQLGDPTAGAWSMVPRLACESSTSEVCLSPLSGVVAIAAGAEHTCAVRDDGTVACWGSGNAGQVGSPWGSSDSPVDVAGITTAELLTAGAEHTCVSLAGGGAQCWGRNSSGQLGRGTLFGGSVPAAVSGITGHVVALDGGAMHTCAVVAGSLSCWGENHEGQLGLGTTTGTVSGGGECEDLGLPIPATQGSCVPAPVAVSAVSDVSAIAAGNAHTCVRTTGGAVRCWGTNIQWQMGNGAQLTSAVPVLVPASTVTPPGG